MKTQKKIRFIEGYSESAWKSLVVKSLRIGWPIGLEEASKRIAKSTVKGLLQAGIFEDVFPQSWSSLKYALAAIERQDYTNLCTMATHHSRGLSELFCDMEKEAVKNAYKFGFEIMKEVRKEVPQMTYLQPRIFNCLYTWWKIIEPNSVSPHHNIERRTVCLNEWKGMPSMIADSHTFEGKINGVIIAPLSGHYENHRAIGHEVVRHGWAKYRQALDNDVILEPNSPAVMQAAEKIKAQLEVFSE